ncbi:MAG: glycosyltransferase family 2 protein [Candidatus Aminicenantes bacterium]|nr:glycosyltransferase family 2 protein [Candidatus Aminicenantes bacterium]
MNYCLSIILPVYNEKHTLREVLSQINRVAPELQGRIEVIIVDDGSTDSSRRLIQEFASSSQFNFEIKTAFHRINKGKGAAIQTALRLAKGDFILIQDADLEYSPTDYPRLLQPLLENQADVVYGSRFLSGQKPMPFINYWANRFLTGLTNLVTGLHLSDMETCYKVFRRQLLTGITLKSSRFGIEPELTIKLYLSGARFTEIPISYRGRKFQEGKKINWKDGLAAIFHIIRFRYFS